nr:MAG TPA: Putative closterovirus papain-like endopeptidase [Caudoviricetes sp.]
MALVKAIVIGSIVSAFLMGITCVLKAIAEELRRQEDGDK